MGSFSMRSRYWRVMHTGRATAARSETRSVAGQMQRNNTATADKGDAVVLNGWVFVGFVSRFPILSSSQTWDTVNLVNQSIWVMEFWTVSSMYSCRAAAGGASSENVRHQMELQRSELTYGAVFWHSLFKPEVCPKLHSSALNTWYFECLKCVLTEKYVRMQRTICTFKTELGTIDTSHP